MWHTFWRAARIMPVAVWMLGAGAFSASADTPVTVGDAHALEQAVAAGQPLVALAPGTFQLDHTLVINRSVSIAGPGAGGATVLPASGDRAFAVQPGGTLSLSALTVQGANVSLPGGAIFLTGGTLNLDAVVLEANRTSAEGGAIATSADGCAGINIAHSALRDNVAADGAALAFAAPAACGGQGAAVNEPPNGHPGTLSVDSTEISGNAASGDGGGLTLAGGSAVITDSSLLHNSGGNGAAIYDAQGDTTLRNDTLAGNVATAGGGIYDAGGALRLTNVTIDANRATRGSAIANDAGQDGVQLVNTVLAGADRSLCAGRITSLGHNLESGSTCGLDGPADRSATAPALAPAADNGGPTFTEAVLAGSRLLDAGDSAVCPGVDQRGVTRNRPCDVGAFESSLDQPAPTPAPTPAPRPAVVPHGAVQSQIGFPSTGGLPSERSAPDRLTIAATLLLAGCLLIAVSATRFQRFSTTG